MSLEGRVAIVTGGSRGIGRGIALALARDGANVAINYRKDDAAAEEVVDAIHKMGREVLAFKTDVRDYDRVKEGVGQVMGRFGKVDILVSNAGIVNRLAAPVADTDVEEFRYFFETHTLGALRFCREVIPVMRKQGRGNIVFISSVAVRDLTPTLSPYIVAKAAIEAMARIMAKEERRHGIRVNVVGPGVIETDATVKTLQALRHISDLKKVYPEEPFGRLGRPEDIAEMVAFLVSSRGEHITGQTIYVDGGSGVDVFHISPV